MKKLGFVAAAFLGLGTPLSAGELLTNGDFETGDFTGWSTSSSGAGGIQVDGVGTTTPFGGQSTAANPSGGSFYAVTSQSGPGSYALAQNFSVLGGLSDLTLSFDLFANNYAANTIIDPIGLDHTGPANQHARVDILVAGANIFSTSPTDVVANFFLGADAGTNPNPYTSYSFDLLAAGIGPGDYQIRFGQTDNQLFFNLGVDNVSIISNAGAVPEPATWAMMLIGFFGIGVSMRSARRQRATGMRHA